MEGKVHVVTCGVKNQAQEIVHAMKDCMQSGYWFVLQNAHLGEAWTHEMLDLLKVNHTTKASKCMVFYATSCCVFVENTCVKTD